MLRQVYPAQFTWENWGQAIISAIGFISPATALGFCSAVARRWCWTTWLMAKPRVFLRIGAAWNSFTSLPFNFSHMCESRTKNCFLCLRLVLIFLFHASPHVHAQLIGARLLLLLRSRVRALTHLTPEVHSPAWVSAPRRSRHKQNEKSRSLHKLRALPLGNSRGRYRYLPSS